jgi:uncharacterized protein YciI
LTGKPRFIDADTTTPGAEFRGVSAVAGVGGAVHFLLLYQFVPDYLQRRPLHRAEHLRLAWEAHDRGELILAGALAEPTDAAVLLFEGETDGAARAFVAADPYVRAGLVTNWSVRPWTTVVGDSAATPVRG